MIDQTKKKLLHRLRDGSAACLANMGITTGIFQELFHTMALVLTDAADEIERLASAVLEQEHNKSLLREYADKLRAVELLNERLTSQVAGLSDACRQKQEGLDYAKERIAEIQRSHTALEMDIQNWRQSCTGKHGSQQVCVEYVVTFQIHGGALVLHVFEKEKLNDH